MKMIPGNGSGATIADYGQYISNCTLDQHAYKIPISGLSDVQLYIDIGLLKPTTILYELIHTCGANAGNVENPVPGSYLVGQDKNNSWYGVFKNFSGVSNLDCFVIAITLDGQIYYSEEYCVERCKPLVQINGCYGNLDPLISTDCNGIYFGAHAGIDEPAGDTSVVYEHKLLMRDVEVSLAAIRNSFKQGRTKTFRTEKEKIFQFLAEFVPEWFLNYVDAVFYRGEVFIGDIKYLVNETQYEKLEDCKRIWRPAVSLRESCYQSFGCEVDPCLPPSQECCDPDVLFATVENIPEESPGGSLGEEMRTVVIQCVIGQTPDVTGTSEPVFGMSDTSTIVSCDAFIGVRVIVERGGSPVPGIDPLNGGTYYTKNLNDNFITFSNGLVDGEFVYIQTIPE